ncbi:MAG TPA: hypothetical protein VKB79_10165 [Bryobacteraceae bacterium]|nr:hypothetical protein [Bryobacteraceae bacterium]
MPEPHLGPADPPRARRVAVVAVHGVGDHPPFVTAREIGDLLSNLEYKPSSAGSPGDHADAESHPPRYSSFTEVTKRINVRPMRPGGGDESPEATAALAHVTPTGSKGPLDFLEDAAYRHSVEPARAEPGPALGLDHIFMKGQVRFYKGEEPEDTYQCLRLEGKRLAAPPSAPGGYSRDAAATIAGELRQSDVQLHKPAPDTEEKIVHIYEMFWSDLSRTANAFTRVFAELYQLLFHLASVSVTTVLAAAINVHAGKDQGLKSKWHRFAAAQRLPVGILGRPIPILNLFMAAVAPVIMLLSLMRSQLSERGEFAALVGLIALLVLAISGFALSTRSRFPRWLYSVPLILFGGLAALIAGVVLWTGTRSPAEQHSFVVSLLIRYFGTPFPQDTTEGAAAVVLLALCFGIVWLIVSAYDKRRPGSKSFALILGGALVLCVVVVFALGGLPVGGRKGINYPAIAFCLNILEVAFDLLALAWLIFFIGFVWAHIAGWIAVHRVSDSSERTKASRTRWTAQLILALSSISFVSFSVPLWTGVAKIAVGMLPGPSASAGAAPVRYRPVNAALYRWLWNHGFAVSASRAVTMENAADRFVTSPPLVSEWANLMLTIAGIAVLPVFLTAFLLAFSIAVWSIFPCVIGEVSPPESPSAKASEALGVWLDRGFRFMRSGGELIYWVFWIPALALVIFRFGLIDWLFENSGIFDTIIKIVGTIVAGTTIGIIGFSGRLKSLAGGLRPVLRVMFDVDNWLREYPRDSNPTARICGRYASLLRHISAWRDHEGNHYDAMVIIAHSQGTVISADFLRYVETERRIAGSMTAYDPELEHFGKMPIYFFTMGCPLHQLYGLRFPFLYGWARNDIPREEIPPGQLPDIQASDCPQPDLLRVERWINAYRSGDYIGRYLWRGGRKGYQWAPAATSYDEEWDPPAGKPARVSADHAGSRIEFCIGPGAHTHYWDHTAAMIAEVLDRLINNIPAAPANL